MYPSFIHAKQLDTTTQLTTRPMYNVFHLLPAEGLMISGVEGFIPALFNEQSVASLRCGSVSDI